MAYRKQDGPETTITCEDIFKGPTRRQQSPMRADLAEAHGPFCAQLQREPEELSERCQPIRTVLTKGVAGIGKTVLTQKFTLDWAEGQANQDVQLLFPFTFRALNTVRERSFSLVGLVQHFFGDHNKTGLCGFENFHDHLNVVFILDGLDECRLPLDFSTTPDLSDPTVSVPVDVLLVNLIRGTLLPSARIWITTRPAAANQIPSKCISMVTEVRGFTDTQKEQYFRKRFGEEANAVIVHMKASRSLFIMCHMPLFCWITATVLEHVLNTTTAADLPRTLTQLFIHFLVVQSKIMNMKYKDCSESDSPWTPESRRMVESLGKLAFEQLQKGNLIFYKSDLTDSDIDPSTASVYSGVFTQVFREESGLYQDKVYCFIHLSVQEFMAALYVHHSFVSTGFNLFSPQVKKGTLRKSKPKLKHLHQTAIDRALESPNGHLDLFLRFLLGLSLPTNQNLLHGLLPNQRSEMSSAQWSALVFILLSSEQDLEVFDLKKFSASEQALLRLLPVVKASQNAVLSSCSLTERSCAALSSLLSSTSSTLTILDLSNNPLKDSGLQKLCEGLKHVTCRLKRLRLSGCLISGEGCLFLTSALMLNPSHLKELDLSYNHLGEQGNKFLLMLQRDPYYRLETVRLEPGGPHCVKPGPRRYFGVFSLDPNTAHPLLKLSHNNTKATLVDEELPYPHNIQRFNHWYQILCARVLPERSYWEVEWHGKVYISVAYQRIGRKGVSDDCLFGFNKESWCLSCSEGGFSVWYDNNPTHLLNSTPCAFGRIGVFVDCPAGILSFYKVSNQLTHLYTFSSTFTDPLFPGFSLLSVNSSVALCEMSN